MKRLIFVSEDLDGMSMAPYLGQFADFLKISFERHDFENAKSLSEKLISTDTWVFLSWPVSNKLREFVNGLGVNYYLLYDGNVKYDSAFLEYIQEDNFLAAPVDTSRDFRHHIPLLRKTEVLETGSRPSEDLISLNLKLTESIETAILELNRVKKIHEKTVPMKSDLLKGMTIFSKFASGERSGGEFFDIVEGEQEALLLLTSTTSYVSSSVILSEFEKLRVAKSFGEENLSTFIKDLSRSLKELDLLDTRDFSTIQLIIAKIDLTKMKVEGFQFGETELFSSEKNYLGTNRYPLSIEFFDKAKFEFGLERGEKILISSPGVRKNCNGLMGKQKFEDFMNNSSSMNPKDLLNEIYFQLKKNLKSDFLTFDASVIHIEVDKNAIIEV